MFNVGGPEVLVILLVALVVLGPEQLPKAMRTFGNVMSEIRKVSSGFQSEMRAAMHAAEADSQSRDGDSQPRGDTSTGSGDPSPAPQPTQGATRPTADGGPSSDPALSADANPSTSSADRAAG